MPRDAEFHNYVMHDLLKGIPGVTSKAMFGGYGIYLRGVIFALIAGGQLYFKVGEENRGEFEQRGSGLFMYEKKDGKKYAMNYWLVPEDILEDRKELALWVAKAASVSGRKKAKGKR